MAFQRFELVKHQRGSTFGTIDKTGRLLLPQSIVEAGGLLPGMEVELYFDPQERQIGFKVVDTETIYSVKIRVNSKPKDEGRAVTLVVSVTTLLTAYQIFIPKRVRGRMGVAPDGMVVFKFEDVTADPLPPNGVLAAPAFAVSTTGHVSAPTSTTKEGLK